MKEILEDWRNNSKEKEEINFLFIRSLKMRDTEEVDRVSKELHEEAFDRIDCLKCGNCCKTTRPLLSDDDIAGIANFKQLSVQETQNRYMELDDDNDWSFNSLPCPFLGLENECEIYESRPKDCREFPHTNKSSFASRSYLHSANTIVCPASFYIIENLKKVFNNSKYD